MTDISELLHIVTTLRHPVRGCPWDRKQTLQSVVPHTLEEAYEVAEVIETKKWNELPGELGDLLFQVLLYCEIAREEQCFDFSDIIRTLADKLVRRHPHVFAENREKIPDWESIKRAERKQVSSSDRTLTNIPHNLPALSRAQKVQTRAASVGFDWRHLQPVMEKINEEITELDEAIAVGEATHIQEEAGDLLFACVNLCRHLHIDAEQSLRLATEKFSRRFNRLETLVNLQDESMAALDEDELEDRWQRVKANGTGSPF